MTTRHNDIVAALLKRATDAEAERDKLRAAIEYMESHDAD